jgi:hypothetical protein
MVLKPEEIDAIGIRPAGGTGDVGTLRPDKHAGLGQGWSAARRQLKPGDSYIDPATGCLRRVLSEEQQAAEAERARLLRRRGHAGALEDERRALDAMRTQLPIQRRKMKELQREADALGKLPDDADQGVLEDRIAVLQRTLVQRRNLESLELSIRNLEAGVKNTAQLLREL